MKLKRAGRALGLALIAALALGALGGAASASASSPQWLSSTQVPLGSSQEFTGEASSDFHLFWEYSPGVAVQIDCNSLSSSGTVENPQGGGASELSASSFALGTCVTNIPGCVIKEGSIDIGPMTGQASLESGDEMVEYEPQQSENGELTVEGESCAINGEYTVGGGFKAEAVADGEYIIDTQVNSGGLTIGNGEASVLGRFTLATPSGVPVALYSEGSADPLWFAGEPERLWYEESIPSWNWLPEGTPTSFSTVGGSTSLALSAEPFGVTIEIDCTESGLSGSVENPSGGGGVATATPTLAGCSTNLSGCTVEASGAELLGTATEVGEGTPAVEFKPAEGTRIATITVEGKECVLPGSFKVKGTLVATSKGEGSFSFNSPASELKLLGSGTVVSGGFVLESEAGEALRIQS